MILTSPIAFKQQNHLPKLIMPWQLKEKEREKIGFSLIQLSLICHDKLMLR